MKARVQFSGRGPTADLLGIGLGVGVGVGVVELGFGLRYLQD